MRSNKAAGWTSSFVITRGMTIGLEGHRLIDETNGNKDSGQQEAEEAAHGFGPSAFRFIRVEAVNTARTQAIGNITAECSWSLGERGGSMEDLDPFNIEAMVQGRPTGSGVYDIYTLA